LALLLGGLGYLAATSFLNREANPVVPLDADVTDTPTATIDFHRRAVTLAGQVLGRPGSSMNQPDIEAFKQECLQHRNTELELAAGLSFQLCNVLENVLAEHRVYLDRILDVEQKNRAETMLGSRGSPEERQREAEEQTAFFSRPVRKRWEAFRQEKTAEAETLLQQIKQAERRPQQSPADRLQPIQ